MSLARSIDIEHKIQRYAVLAIANLASSVDNHKAVVDEGALPLLISLSNAPDPEIRQYAAFALVSRAQRRDSKRGSQRKVALSPSFPGTHGGSRNSQEVLPALCTLSFEANKVEIAKHRLLPLTNGPRYQSRLVSAGLRPRESGRDDGKWKRHREMEGRSFLRALDNPNVLVRREAGRCLGNLAANKLCIRNLEERCH